MSTEYTGRGDLTRSVKLLWDLQRRPSRGPKPGLTLDQVTAAAIALADDEGLEGVSMRRIAQRLHVGTMSLYRYVPSKAELLDLMVDQVSGETEPADEVAGDWRARVEHVARANLRLYQLHPWLLQVFPWRPAIGPGVLGKYEHELRALDGIGLTDVEMDLVLTNVLTFVRAAAAGHVEAEQLPRRTGRTDHEWWHAMAPVLERVFDAERYPLAARVGTAATEHYQGTFDPTLAFEFGLERLVDGIETFVAGKRRL
jgi:AcrR family transcriptional regulator